MVKKGVKIGLGEFLGRENITAQDRLPSGPREFDPAGDPRRGGRGGRGGRYEDREASRSDQDNKWRGGGGMPSSSQSSFSREPKQYEDSDNVSAWRGGAPPSRDGGSSRFDRNDGGGSRFDRNDGGGGGYDGAERPRMNLTRRGDGAAPAAPSSAATGDKWGSMFRGGDSSSSRGGGYESRGGNERFGSSRGGDRFGRNDGYGRDASPADRLTERMGQASLKGPSEAELAKEAEVQRKADSKAAIVAQKAADVAEKKRKVQVKADAVAAAKATAAAKTVADTAVAEAFIAQALSKRGKELTKFATTFFAEKERTPPASLWIGAFLNSIPTAKTTTTWIAEEELGDVLAKFVLSSDAKTDQMRFLYAIQLFFHSISFPRGLIEKVFMALYQNDIVDEDAYMQYKYDVDDETPGKMKAIIQTTEWLSWLETAAEEDEDDEDEEEDDLLAPPMTL